MANYDSNYYEGNSQCTDRPAIAWYAKLLRNCGAEPPFLDLGCGTGFLLKRLSMMGTTYGFDSSAYAVARAREIAPEAKLITGTEELPSKSIRSVVAIHLIEHLTDDQLSIFLSEVDRISCTGAKLLIATPDRGGLAAELHGEKWIALQDQTHINLQSSEFWRRRITSLGWSVVSEGSDGMWNGPYRSTSKIERWLRLVSPARAVLSGKIISKVGRGESYVAIFEKNETDK